MKKCVLLGCALFAIAQGVNAQEREIAGEREPRFGIEGGVNLNNMLDHYQGETTSNQLKVGFHVGVLGDIMLTDHLYFQPGLRYIMKGGQQERSWTVPEIGGATEIERKDKITTSYAELPLNLVFKFGGQDSRFFIGVGGYIATLLDAKTKYKYKEKTEIGETENELTLDDKADLRIGNDPGDEIKRMDYGLSGQIGWEFSRKLFVKGTVEAGLTDIGGERNVGRLNAIVPMTEDVSSKNLSYLLTVGYFFER